jgi:uncharacterized protein (TIGR04255 family)
MAAEFPHYDGAPLTEAVIEFRFAEPLNAKTLELLRRRFARPGWREEHTVEIEFKIGEAGAPKQKIVGYKFSSDDGVRVIQINNISFACSAMSPYPGWDVFTEFLFESYNNWKKEASRKLIRIGVRYINRFDVPISSENAIKIENYLNFRLPTLPLFDKPMDGYAIMISSGIVSDNLGANLNSAVIASPLIDHIGLTLDIDLYRWEVDVPQNDSDIKALLDLIRLRRTEIFETCLTPASRTLIS